MPTKRRRERARGKRAVSPAVAIYIKVQTAKQVKANSGKSPTVQFLETCTNILRDGQAPSSEWAKDVPPQYESCTIGVLGV